MKYLYLLKKILFLLVFIHTLLIAKSDTSLSNLIQSRPNDKTLIVGCGKHPFKWEEIESDLNGWRSLEGTELAGDHSHPGAFTLAEDPKIEPDILFDFTQKLPDILHGCFDNVYLEVLPPLLLGQKIIWKNAYKALAQGRKLISEFQIAIRFQPDIQKAKLDNINPFIMIAGKRELRKEQELGFPLHLITQAYLNKDQKVRVRKMLNDIGFSEITFEDWDENPFNKRIKITSMIVARKKNKDEL